jgi:cytochrome P450
MASLAPFIPAQPPRTPDWVPTWRSYFGERMRNSVYGWPQPAFELLYRKRSILGKPVHIVSDPDAIGRIFLDHRDNYPRPGLAKRILAPVLGNGLLSAEGEDWKTQRRLVAPTFAPGAVAHMAAVIERAALAQIDHWPRQPSRLDMAQEATSATMKIIAEALFSNDHRLASGEAGMHIDNLISSAGQARLTTMLGLNDLDPSPTMRRARKGRDYLRSTLAAVVRERGPSGGADDFFGGLIRSLHQHFPHEVAEKLAFDNAITFYVAGHETTSNALAWTIYLLAAQPGLQEQARDEAIAALSGDVATLSDRVPLLRQIVDESMRLYPPAPQLSREAREEDELCGEKIGKGDLILVYPWVVHRHRKLWNNADAFDHTRFMPEAKAQQHRFQYIPFGAGPRVCVGARFSIVEALVILAHWLAARRFSMPPGFKPYPVGSVTLRPRGGMPLFVEPR